MKEQTHTKDQINTKHSNLDLYKNNVRKQDGKEGVPPPETSCGPIRCRAQSPSTAPFLPTAEMITAHDCHQACFIFFCTKCLLHQCFALAGRCWARKRWLAGLAGTPLWGGWAGKGCWLGFHPPPLRGG